MDHFAGEGAETGVIRFGEVEGWVEIGGVEGVEVGKGFGGGDPARGGEGNGVVVGGGGFPGGSKTEEVAVETEVFLHVVEEES